MQYALEVYADDQLIFHNNGKWLYPLFDLEEFLNTQTYDPATLVVRDKIIGRAAALVLVNFGIRKINAGMMSKSGEEILKKFNVEYTYEQRVDRIACATEDLLIDEFDPLRAYEFIKKRANR